MPIYKIEYTRIKVSDITIGPIRMPSQALPFLLERCFPKEENWREKSYLLLLDSANNLAGYTLIGVGGFENITVDIKLVLKAALDCNASSVILVHNHPTNNVLPSQTDIVQTGKLKKALALVNIKLLDHIILGDDIFFSFDEEKIIEYNP